MAGGTFTSMNKIRPGAYMNFQSATKARGGIGASGTIAMTLPLDWGATGFTEVTAQSDFFVLLGRQPEEQELFLLREALKAAERVLLYNVAGEGSEKAAITADALQVTATRAGALGNEIKLVIVENLDETYTVLTYFRGVQQDRQTVAIAEELEANEFVTFSGEGILTETAGINLSGGTTVAPTAEDYTNYLKELELQEFYAFTLEAIDKTIKDTAVTYCKKWRDREGKKCILVLADSSADYEGVISVENGVILANGQKLSAQDTLTFVAGATASAGIAKSLTYLEYPEAVDANPRLSQTDVEKALQSGRFVFTKTYDKVVVEQDINSLVTFSTEKNKDFRKNKIIRIIDTFNDELVRVYTEMYNGKVTNNQDGRDLLKKDIINILEEMRKVSAVEYYSDEDIQVLPGAEKDTVLVSANFVANDAMEKLYATVTLR